MSTPPESSVSRLVARVNSFQDRLVRDYLQPHCVTFAYWAFALVFVYLGLQKVLPHRSSVDVQLSTVAGLVGLPYIPFVTFVGIWEVIIGVLFYFLHKGSKMGNEK